MLPRRCLFALAVFGAVPLLAACPKKETPVVDAGPPAPVVEDSGPVMLAPLEEDAGVDSGVDAGKKATGPYVPTNVARLQACCAALKKQAAGLGASPEAGMVTQAAVQCSAIAASVGPNGTAPETGVIRGLLAGKTVPNACNGF